VSTSASSEPSRLYPQEAYAHVGVHFPPGRSKRAQEDRRTASAAVLAWAKRYGVIFSGHAREQLLDGFGPSKSGEDQFDALIGLLSMIEVVDGRRREGGLPTASTVAWEGWNLGQTAAGAALTPRQKAFSARDSA